MLVLTLGPLLLKGDSRRTWSGLSQQALLLICTGMAGVSVVLVGLMLFTIKAVCVFCVLSAVLSTVLFALSLLLNRQEERGSLIFRVVLTGLLVFLLGLGWASLADQPAVSAGPGVAPSVRAESSPAKVELAKHLTQSGARTYTAYGAPIATTRRSCSAKKPLPS